MKKVMALAVATALSSTQMVIPVHAGGRDFVAGAIVGGAVGLIAGSVKKSRAKKRSRGRNVRKSNSKRMDPTVRENNRELQRRLNELGYNVGKPDGVLGRKSKAAISAFQRENGFAPTGVMSPEQSALLYSRTAGSSGMALQSGPVVPGTAPVAAAAPAFPAIGGGQSRPGMAPNGQAFPALGGQGQSGQLMGQTAPAKFGASMPTFGTPASPMAPPAKGVAAGLGTAAAISAMPAVASPSTESQSNGGAISTANTDLSFSEGAPAVFGIELGQSYAEALQSLEENGYQNCSGQDEFLTCSSKKDGVSERITIARGLQQQDVPVYFMDRTATITVDVEQEVIEARIAQAYPKIFAAPQQIISNSAECAGHMAELRNIDGFSNALSQLRKQKNAVNDWLEQSLAVCESFYKVDVMHDGKQFRVRVVMFDSSYLQNEIARLGQKNLEKVNSQLKF